MTYKLTGKEKVFLTFGTSVNPEATTAEIAALAASNPAVVVPKTATAYTLNLAEQGSYIPITNAAAITVTIPTNAAVPLPIGATYVFEQSGAGAITLSAAGGVTLNYYSPSSAGSCATVGEFAVIQLVKKAANVWTASGGIA